MRLSRNAAWLDSMVFLNSALTVADAIPDAQSAFAFVIAVAIVDFIVAMFAVVDPVCVWMVVSIDSCDFAINASMAVCFVVSAAVTRVMNVSTAVFCSGVVAWLRSFSKRVVEST